MDSTSIFIMLFLGLMCFALISLVYFYEEPNSKNLYSGPVPEGYDEDYFRKTGITKPLENKI